MASPAAQALALLMPALSPTARAWFEPRAAAAATAPPIDVLSSFTATARRVGSAPLARATTGDLAWLFDGAGTDEVARATLLAHAGGDLPALAAEAYRQGDNREKRAVLRALALFPEPGRFTELGATACRTHVLDVFEALACQNPWPAAWLPAPAFNQMVLKALFLEVPLARVMGLDARITPELIRMAHGYASERRAAGRSVPADISRFFGSGGPA